MFGENTNYGTTSWPPQHEQTNTSNKYSISILLVTTMAIIFVIAYCYMNGVEISNPILYFISGSNTDTDEAIIIEYNYDEFMVFKQEISISDFDEKDLSFGSLMWMDFHHTLISKNGYDTSKFSDYTFKISDNAKKSKGKSSKNSKHSKKGATKSAPTPKPTPITIGQSPSEINGNFECFTKYKYGTIPGSAFYLDLDCYDVGEKKSKPCVAQMTGCISYSGHNKYRSGELIQNGTADTCIAWSDSGKSVEPIGIGVRCCKTIDTTQRFSVSPNSGVGADEYCAEANCQNNKGGYGVELGCVGNYGVGDSLSWSQQTMGVKHNSRHGNCEMSRHDQIKSGITTFVEVQPLCGTVNHGTIECYDTTGSIPPKSELETYLSIAICVDGYSLIDCNSYIQTGIDQCYPSGENYGVTYGGYFDSMGFGVMGKVQCVAEGSWMNIRAQARCCKVV